MTPTLDVETLRGWIGTTQTRQNVIEAQPANLMEMILDRAPRLTGGDPLPPLWHWLYFLESARMSKLGRDGHPATGGFLPPVGLPRRMWAGGRFGFKQPVRIGASATKTSAIQDVQLKSGRSGLLCFVTVRHEVMTQGELAFWEEHDIVYREDPKHGDTPRLTDPVGTDWTHTEQITPSEVMLFRYSALTFNGHRIHYDREYARTIEGHDGLVVHGPLIATLLVDLAQRRMQAAPRSFSFQAKSPVYDGAPFTLHASETAGTVRLAAATSNGRLAMSATATF